MAAPQVQLFGDDKKVYAHVIPANLLSYNVLFFNSVYHNSHNAPVIRCIPVPVSAKCTTDLNIHHVA